MNSPSGLIKKIMILVLILALPGFLYYLLTAKGKNRYRPLPIYGPKTQAKTSHTFHGNIIPDTIYHIADDFKLTDQDGKAVSFKTIGNKLIVLSFFFTNCPSICAQVNANMDSLEHIYKQSKVVQFVSITVDPNRDTPPTLKKYANMFGVTANKWEFLTGDTAMIYNLARAGLFLNVRKDGPGKDDFIYDDRIVLLDSEHRIRGYYHGTSSTDMARLNDEIAVQITEELRKIESPEM